MNYRLLVCLLALPLIAFGADDKKPTIKKCQDATGKWHYGDSAAAECAKSKVTEISKEGIKKREIAAPLSEAELKRLAESSDSDARQRLNAEEQKRADQILLSTYGHEDDINLTRDRKISQLESSIKSSTETLVPLNKTLERLMNQAADEEKAGKPSDQTRKGIDTTKMQIGKHEAAIAAKRQEQEKIRKQAEVDRERYRELRSSKTDKAAGAQKK